MAPSAALATAPPREAPNVSRDRPLVNETRRDELTEMMSFKGGDKAADGATPKADAPAVAPSGVTAQGRRRNRRATAAPRLSRRSWRGGTAEPAPAHPASETSAAPPAAPEATPPRRDRPGEGGRRRAAADVPSGHAAALSADAKRCRPRPRPAGGRFAGRARPRRGREDRSATGRSGVGGEGPFERIPRAGRSGESRNAYARKDHANLARS